MTNDELVVTSQNPYHDTLYTAAVGIDDTRLHRAVGWLQADLAAFLVEALERGFSTVEQGDDLLAIASLLAALDDDVVAVAEMVFDHAVPAHAQDIYAAARVEHGFQVEFFAIFDG